MSSRVIIWKIYHSMNEKTKISESAKNIAAFWWRSAKETFNSPSYQNHQDRRTIHHRIQYFSSYRRHSPSAGRFPVAFHSCDYRWKSAWKNERELEFSHVDCVNKLIFVIYEARKLIVESQIIFHANKINLHFDAVNRVPAEPKLRRKTAEE